MKSDNNNEIFPIVDIEGNTIGKATRGECHSGSFLLHPVVHVHLFDSAGRLYLQRRPDWKDIQPGKWDTAVGGHVDYGEPVSEAVVREAREEVGVDVRGRLRPLTPYVFESDRERELVNPYVATVDESEIHPSEELDGGRFWTLDEIRQNLGKQIFTPNFESEFQRLFS